MNRRELIGTLFSGTVARHSWRKPSAKENILSRSNEDVKLAGMSLEQLRTQYRYDLFEDFLPFMDKHVIDHQYGGFMCDVDRDGARLSDRKETLFEGRGIWVYSFLYRNFGKDERHLEVARKSLDFILKSMPSGGDVLWPDSFTRQGQPLTPPATIIYGDLCVAEGFAEFARASGEERFWDLAKQIILKCLRIYDRPDYDPNIIATYVAAGLDRRGPKVFPLPGARIQGVSMLLIRAITQMLELHADQELERIMSRCLDVVLNYHYNPEFTLNNELLNHDFSRPTNELSQFVYTGHSIEILWMLLYEAERTKNKALFRTVAERFQRHVEVAWDSVYGGVFRSLNDVDQNLWSLDKVLWAQEEVLIGTLFIYEQTGSQWAQDMFGKMFTYVQDKYPLKRRGYPLWIPAADRKVNFPAHPTPVARTLLGVVEAYHHPRHLMLNLLTIERMIRNGGKVPPLSGESAQVEAWWAPNQQVGRERLEIDGRTSV